jgi:hypothetical protein
MTTKAQRNDRGGRLPRLRQMLAWATGDRAAEGEALADRAGPSVGTEDATLAVRRAHGDLGVPPAQGPVPDDDAGGQDFAGPKEARAERDAQE